MTRGRRRPAWAGDPGRRRQKGPGDPEAGPRDCRQQGVSAGVTKGQTPKAAGEDSTAFHRAAAGLTASPGAVAHLAFSAFVTPDFSGSGRRPKVKSEKAWEEHCPEAWR